MEPNIFVIDDFYDDPWKYRTLALEAEYEDGALKNNYSGRNSVNRFINKEAIDKISSCLGLEVIPSPDTSSGSFRITLDGEEGKMNIHSDMFEDYAAVLYLTLPTHCKGMPGTSFYRHKKTNTYNFPNKMEALVDGWSSPWELKQGFTTIDGKDLSKWEKYFTVPMKYNRMVLFNSKNWHGSEEGFGTNLYDGRLVQIFFLKVA